jgi:hypothetical protein
MALCFIIGLVSLFFPFGKESTRGINGVAVKSQAQVSLEEIRSHALTSSDDVQALVAWFNGFYGYNPEIPSSVRYLHMMEWREVVERYKDLPAEIAPLWAILVHRNGGGKFSAGFQ